MEKNTEDKLFSATVLDTKTTKENWTWIVCEDNSGELHEICLGQDVDEAKVPEIGRKIVLRTHVYQDKDYVFTYNN